MIDTERISSVDDLPEMPGYDPITMAQLWKIADYASDVAMSARGHIADYDSVGDQHAYDLLSSLITNLIFVMQYTCDLRAVKP